MQFGKQDSFQSKKTLEVNGKKYVYFSLEEASKKLGIILKEIPNSIKVLYENLLRNEDGKIVKKQDVEAIKKWLLERKSDHEIAYNPARVLMQDFTGVPAVVDLAAMRDAAKNLGGDPKKNQSTYSSRPCYRPLCTS